MTRRFPIALLAVAAFALAACSRSEAPSPGQSTTSGQGAGTGITAAPSDAKGDNGPVMGVGSAPPNPPGEASGTPGAAGAGSGAAGRMPPQDSHISAPSGGAEAETAKDNKK